MISHPEKYLDDFVRAGCDSLTIHVEACPDPVPVLRRIRQAGCEAGLAINPKTPVSAIAPFVSELDMVLVMSVEPGFGGQKFIPGAVEKVREVRALIGPKKVISIDGGIGPATIAAASTAGADVFVAGSSIFDLPDYRAAAEQMFDLARQSRLKVSRGSAGEVCLLS